jgi:hypothetical protein
MTQHPGARLTRLAPAVTLSLLLLVLVVYVFRAIFSGELSLPGVDAGAHFMWENLTRTALASGLLPHWNPYSFAGTPLMADPQSIVWYPPAMLLRWLPPAAFLSWMAVLHVWFGGVGTLLLGRVVGLSWFAAAAAALCVTLGGTSAARLYNGHLLVINCVAWLPWALAFSVLSVRRPTLLPHPALVLVMVLQLLAGFPQASLYITGGVCVYFLFSVAWPDTPESGVARWHPLAQVAVLGLLTAGLSSFQLLPSLRLAGETARAAGIPYVDATQGQWTLASLATAFWPFMGAVSQPPPRDIADSVAYVGWLLTCTVPFAFLDERRRRAAAACAVLVAISVAFALGDHLGLYRLHYALFPGFRLPGRVLFVATVGLAILGALGLEQLVAMAGRRQWRRLVLPAIVSIAALSAAASTALARWDPSHVFPLHGWPWLPVVAIAGLGLVVLLGARVGARAALAAALVVCGVDVTAFSADGAHPVSIETADAVRRWVGPSSAGRVFSLCPNRIDSGDLAYVHRPGLSGRGSVSLSGYTEWLDLTSRADRGSDTIGDTPIRRDLLNLAGVSTVVACRPVAARSLTQVSYAYPVFAYRNDEAWPRAVWTCAVEEAPRSQVAARLRAGRFEDVGHFKEPPPDRSGEADSALETLVGTRSCDAAGRVTVTRQDALDGGVSAEVDAPVPGFVFLSEPFYPERVALVDGRPVQARKANLAFTAVPVPAGQHRLELRYVPSSFNTGLGVTALTMVAWTGASVLTRSRRHNASRREARIE